MPEVQLWVLVRCTLTKQCFKLTEVFLSFAPIPWGANGCWLSRCRCSDGQGGTLAFGTICTLTKVWRAWSRSLWRLRAGFVGSSGSVALQSPQEASTLTMVSHCSVACSTGNQLPQKRSWSREFSGNVTQYNRVSPIPMWVWQRQLSTETVLWELAIYGGVR